MRRKLRFGLAWMILGTPAVVARGEDPKPAPAAPSARLVAFEELERNLRDEHLRLLDARPAEAYDKGHLPGAVRLDMKAAEKLAARAGGLADREAWAAWIAPLGIGPETHVLVYDANRQKDAARAWWLLRYLGVRDVGLVDGGYPLWAREQRPVTTATAAPAPRPFPVAFQHDRHASRDDVLAALRDGHARIIDARSEAEHTGTQRLSRRAGRIPTSCSLEWTDLVDADGRFLPEAALRKRLDRAGVKAGEPVITHCQSGGRASVDAFVFERLGFPTRNYYLGWSDWGNAEQTPVESGSATPPR